MPPPGKATRKAPEKFVVPSNMGAAKKATAKLRKALVTGKGKGTTPANVPYRRKPQKGVPDA